MSYNTIKNFTNYGIYLQSVGNNNYDYMESNRFIYNNVSNSPTSVRLYGGYGGYGGYNQYNVFENNKFSNGTYGVYLDSNGFRVNITSGFPATMFDFLLYYYNCVCPM